MSRRTLSLSSFGFFLIYLCLLGSPLHAQAPQTEWFVSVNGNDQLDGTSGQALASVQRAISLIRRAYTAQPFDTATINIHGMIRNYGPDATDIAMVTLRGGGLPAIIFRGESAESGLDAGGRLMVLYIENTPPVSVENLIITGGYASIGGGALVINNNFTLGPGGVIEGNSALRGGSILIDNLANLNQEGAIISGNTPNDVEEGT